MVADLRDQIIIPEPVERVRFAALKIMRGVGPREVGAIVFSFLVTIISLPAPIGLVEKIAIIALCFAVSLGVVKFRWRGYTLEHLVRIYIKFHTSPRIYINQRAYPVTRFVDIPAPAPEIPKETPKPQKVPSTKVERVSKPKTEKMSHSPRIHRPILSSTNLWVMIGIVFAIALLYTAYILLSAYNIF